MTLLASLLPRVIAFAVSALLSAAVATVVVSATQDHGPVSTVGDAPEFLLQGPDTPAGPGVPAAFDEQASGQPTVLSALAPADLASAADKLLGGEPVAFVNPSGFPRIPPITQFDGGPFQNSNCMLASGAMLARLGAGIVTSGSVLRELQDDRDGGTGIDDLRKALWRGYGITFPNGLIRPSQLKSLLAAGYGAAIQGEYGKIPRGIRLQRDYTGGHAIYLDGYYPGDAKRGIPEAYYVIDPIGRPKFGYEGDWWPASVVDDFATAFGGGRIAAMWAFPPGGVPPDVVGPDVVPIPPDSGGGGPSATPTPGPSASAGPTPSAGPSAAPSPPVIVPIEPGDISVTLVPGPLPVSDTSAGGIALLPFLDICLGVTKPPFCPTGIEATFALRAPPVIELPRGPTVTIVFVDSDRPDVAIVGFTVDPPATANVRFWEADGSPATIANASSMTSFELLGRTVILARLDVLAGTTYRFQAVAGDGLRSGVSPVGTFTTGGGVAQFDVALSDAPSPVFALGSGLSPYVHLAEGAYARPMIPLGSLGGTSCLEAARFGGTSYCLDAGDAAPAATACTRARVTYALSGIEADSVVIRAFPAVSGMTPDGDMTLGGVLEAGGPVPSGDVSVGCLAPGLTYHIAIDAIGDDRGILATRTVSVP